MCRSARGRSVVARCVRLVTLDMSDAVVWRRNCRARVRGVVTGAVVVHGSGGETCGGDGNGGDFWVVDNGLGLALPELALVAVVVGWAGTVALLLLVVAHEEDLEDGGEEEEEAGCC